MVWARSKGGNARRRVCRGASTRCRLASLAGPRGREPGFEDISPRGKGVGQELKCWKATTRYPQSSILRVRIASRRFSSGTAPTTVGGTVSSVIRSSASFARPKVSTSESSLISSGMPAPVDTPRGSLKVYLGYAAGVGKTFQMLADGHAAAQRGVDVVVAYFEPHTRPDTIGQAQGLEIVQHRKIEYPGKLFQEMDTEAVLRRKPQIACVAELAHTNVPGSESTTRSQNFQAVRNAPPNVVPPIITH